MALKNTFYKLPIPDQCRLLYLEGEFIMAIRYYEYKVNLYRFGDELIEVFYNHKLDRIHKIQPIESQSSRMSFYADQVSLSSLNLPQEGS